MRLFISINFDRPVIERLLECQNRLRRLGSGNFSTPENLHLTLAFLGEVDEDRLDELKAVMDGINVPRMRLIFSKASCFRAADELWWVGAEENAELTRLQSELIKALVRADFSPDIKRFRPHITLARRMNIGHVETDRILKAPFSTEAGSISLMLSHRPGGKLTYTELYRKESGQ